LRSEDEESKEYKERRGNRLLIELVYELLVPGAFKERVQTVNSGFVWT